MNTLVDIARATAEEHALLPAGSVCVAMVSGGADSMAMLHLLAEGHLGEDLRVSALHVNHLLRGADADADEEFVVAECARLGIACRTVRFDVAAHAEAGGLNLEDAGREVRYRFAEEEADARAAAADTHPRHARIAVAHTLDDRIETLCMRLLAGSGAGGLGSIRHVRGRIVRPLLDCDRAAVRTWLESQGGVWREDATNVDTSRTRARIRHELLPTLERIEPAFRTTLARSMRILAEEDALLAEMARAFVRDFSAEEGRDGEVALDRALVRTLSAPMRRRVVREAIASAYPEASRIDSAHIDSVAEGFDGDSFARDLPYGLRAFAEYDRMVVVRRGEGSPGVAPCLLPIPGTAELGASGVVTASLTSPEVVDVGPCEVIVDVGGADVLTVTGVRPGDRMRPLGMEGTKKLSDVLVDAKVPARERPAVPVVRDGESIVWLAGVRVSDEHKVGAHTTRAVRLTWHEAPATRHAEKPS